MHEMSQEALRLTGELNGRYHAPEQMRAILAQLFGTPVDESVALLPPFYSDLGKNIHLGKRIFINTGCKFQDQGGTVIGDGALIGHNAVLATLNHDTDPRRRGDMHPAPIRIGNKVDRCCVVPVRLAADWVRPVATTQQGGDRFRRR